MKLRGGSATTDYILILVLIFSLFIAVFWNALTGGLIDRLSDIGVQAGLMQKKRKAVPAAPEAEPDTGSGARFGGFGHAPGAPGTIPAGSFPGSTGSGGSPGSAGSRSSGGTGGGFYTGYTPVESTDTFH
jgi:hypothetical protein